MHSEPLLYTTEENWAPDEPPPAPRPARRAGVPKPYFHTWKDLKEANFRSGEYFFVAEHQTQFGMRIDPPYLYYGRFFITCSITPSGPPPERDGPIGEWCWKIREIQANGQIRVVKPKPNYFQFPSADQALVALHHYVHLEKAKALAKTA